MVMARKSLRLWFSAGYPSATDADDLKLLSNDGAGYLDRQWRLPIQELAGSVSFYHANLHGRDFNPQVQKRV